MSIVAIFKTLRWMFDLFKHIFLGNKSFSYYMRARRKATLMFMLLIAMSSLVLGLSVQNAELRAKTKEAGKQLNECAPNRECDNKPPLKSGEVNTAPPPKRDSYDSSEHSRFMNEYFDEIEKNESKGRK
jgi:hypothetical protein